jgi:sugar lactone lactonase YvrE
MTRPLLVAAIAAVVVGAAHGAATTEAAFPTRIDLPDGFQPEGIANAGERFFVGSISTGAVYSGSLRTGRGAVFVQPARGRSAIGLKAHRGRLYVAGGNTGNAYVYSAKNGALLRTYSLSAGGSFVNDVVVTRRAAWFTDSFKPVLYRVPLAPSGAPGAPTAVTTVPLSGDYRHGGSFNVNGIDATANGRTLVIVQSSTGTLFTVTPAGAARTISLANGGSVPDGDGILLDGRTLYVVQNRLNVISRIALSPNLRTGRIVRGIRSAGFDVPTTAADLGRRLYALNARFGTTPTPTTAYWVTQVRK